MRWGMGWDGMCGCGMWDAVGNTYLQESGEGETSYLGRDDPPPQHNAEPSYPHPNAGMWDFLAFLGHRWRPGGGGGGGIGLLRDFLGDVRGDVGIAGWWVGRVGSF